MTQASERLSLYRDARLAMIQAKIKLERVSKMVPFGTNNALELSAVDQLDALIAGFGEVISTDPHLVPRRVK